MLYGEWFTKFETLYCKKLAPKTLEGHARLAALLSPMLNSIPLEEITAEHIQAALLAVEAATGPRQAQLAYAFLHAVFARACRSRLLSWNPVAAVDKPQHTPQQGRAITGADWQTLEAPIRADIAFSLMAFAGLRRGEVLGITRADVDFTAQLLHVRRQRVRVAGRMVSSAPKSAAGVRDVPILPILLPQLQAACRYCLPSAPLVRCAPETLAHRWRATQLAAGIAQPYRLHDLRHTYATRLVLAGCNPRVLQYIIGHADIALTMHTYAHIGPNEAATELSRLKF